MLLSLMRKHAKSWLIKFIIAVIAIVFIFYFGWSFTTKRALKVASVNGEVISSNEYRKAYIDLLEAIKQQYKDYWNENLLKILNLRQKALDQLISEKLINQEANKLGFDVLETEIQRAIISYPAFEIGGQFDMRQYRALLNQYHMQPEDFEATIAKGLLGGKVRQFQLSFMSVTDQEVLDYYTYKNEQVKISFVQFKPDEFKKSLKPDDAVIEEYFKKNREKYRVPEKIKLAYIDIDPKAYEKQVKITDQEIKDYYDYNIELFSQPKQVRVRSIFFNVNEAATEEEENEVKKNAQAVLTKARQGDDFADLAKQYSEGPAKEKGGDQGYFSQGQTLKPIEDVAFSLEVGQISDLIRTKTGYHIIKVDDIREAVEKPLDEVRSQIIKTLTTDAAQETAHNNGLNLIDQMPYDVPIDEYMAERGLRAKHTDYFSQAEPMPILGTDHNLRESIFALNKNETSDLIELGGKYYIFQVADKKASYVPEMTEVIVEVRTDAIDDLAATRAKAAAVSYLTELNRGKDWDTLAEERQRSAEETKFFTRKGPISEIGNIPGILETAFGLNENKPYPDQIFESPNGAFIIRWAAYKAIDEDLFQAKKEEERFSLMQEKGRSFFTNWISDLERRADIEIITPVTDQ